MVPDGPAYAAVIRAADAGLPIAVPTVVFSEVSYGVKLASGRNPALVMNYEWLLGLIADALLQPLALDIEAADVAGELRAMQPIPPTTGTKRTTEKPERRAGWVLDLFVAATAWVNGCDVVTRNRRDFERIAELLPVLDEDDHLQVSEPVFDR